MGLHYLLGRKQAKSDCFSEMVHLLEVRPLSSPPLSLFRSAIDDPPLAVDFFKNKNRCSSQIKVRTGQQVMRHVKYFKNAPLTFRNVPTTMTTRLCLHIIIW